MRGIYNVWVGPSSDTVEVNIQQWDDHDECGIGTLANREEVEVFTSYDGDGYLVLSDQDAARFQ
jgi:hypothetical protein